MQHCFDLYHFNATCEMEVGNGTHSFTPPQYLQQFEMELELLPLYLSHKNDYLLIKNRPSDSFIDRLGCLKTDLPIICSANELLHSFENKAKLNYLKPWGWSPKEHAFLSGFKEFCSESFKNQPNSIWHENHRDLYGRHTSLNVLKHFLANTQVPELFIGKEFLPQKCHSLQAVLDLHGLWKKIIVKAPWSSSGRGILILDKTTIHDTYFKWINSVIAKQGFVMCEPFFNKVHDLSFHFEIVANKHVEFLGQASFATDHRGQYVGNYIQKLPPDLNEEQLSFLCSENLEIISVSLKKAIIKSTIFKYYTGVLGVDVLFYSDSEGNYRFHPCMEINLRQNMGTVALKIRELLHPEAKGMWQVKRFHKPNPNDAIEFDNLMHQQHPLVIESGKLLKGYLPLIEPFEQRNYALYLVAQ